jgi:hypothetical protein
MRRHITLLAILILLTFTIRTARADSASLLSNGNFEAAVGSPAWPEHWPRAEGASYEVEAGNHFLRLTPAKEGQMLTLYRAVDVKPEHKAFALSFRVRTTDLKRGKANWHDGRIILDFKSAAGDKLKHGPRHPNFSGTTKGGWIERTVEFSVPAGATKLEVMPALFQVASGQMDLDDLVLTPITAAAKVEALVKAAAPPAPWATPAAVAAVAAPAAERMPKELRVVGNQIQTSDGKAVWLQGLALPSMEWSAKGENILKSVEVGIDQWKANVIRLPIKDNFWFGHGPYQNDKGAAYRRTVADVVNMAAARGAYVIIDLHRYRAPEKDHAAFWTDVAGHYKDHPAVLFELLNEPHGITWDVWQRGGHVMDKKKGKDGVVDENAESTLAFESVGMQALLDAVRATGANNVVIAGGLDWGYDLGGVLDGHALVDTTSGHGVVYSSHVYPWKSDWQKKFLDAAARVPVFIGECGGEVERLAFIPPERHEDPHTWCPDFLGVVQRHKLHWTAWSFHPKASPRVIKDWEYTPTEFWGAYVKRALAGEGFEAKRMR